MNFFARYGKVMPRALLAFVGGPLIGALLFALFQIGSIYVRNHELETAARREARFAAASTRPIDAIRDDIYRKARDLGLPVEMGEIKVQSSARGDGPSSVQSILDSSTDVATTAYVDIDVVYAAPVKLPGWTFHLNFRLHADDRHM